MRQRFSFRVTPTIINLYLRFVVSAPDHYVIEVLDRLNLSANGFLLSFFLLLSFARKYTLKKALIVTQKTAIIEDVQ